MLLFLRKRKEKKNKITLLNMPYKIASSSIAQRLKSVLLSLYMKIRNDFLKGELLY